MTDITEQITLGNDEHLNDAFMLGWQLVELKSRIKIALVEEGYPSLQRARIWRSLFNRIASLHVKSFPNSVTAETLYQPPDKNALPYLYPPEPDYANLGIPVRKNDKNEDILKDFALYEVTRRGINCLTVLYVKEEESLIPENIRTYQNKIVTAILEATKNKDEGGGDLQAAEKAISEQSPDLKLNNNGQINQENLDKAKAVITEIAYKFLEAWDGFLRENFYTGGKIPNNDSELVAYESGRSIAALSWNISQALVPIEQKQKEQPTGVTEDQLKQEWRNVFQERIVVLIQHQISGLSAVLDEAYYKKKPSVKREVEGAVLVMPNPDLPSNIIQAVKFSLDYWYRTVNLISNTNMGEKLRGNNPSKIAHWSYAMRSALKEQTNIWQTLLTGEQSLRTYTLGNVTHKLIEEVTEGIQKSFRTDFKDSFKQIEVGINELTMEAKEAIEIASKAAITGLEDLYKSFKGFFWPILGVIVLMFVVLFFLPLINKDAQGLASGGVGITGIISAILAIFGMKNINGVKSSRQSAVTVVKDNAKMKVDNQVSATKGTVTVAAASGNGNTLLTRIGNAARETGNMVFEAFEKGYEQIRIELAGIGHSTAVSYPLIEFFATSFDLSSDEDFLTSVIWNGDQKREEIKRIVTAAFGPLAIFITSTVPRDEEDKSNESKNINPLNTATQNHNSN